MKSLPLGHPGQWRGDEGNVSFGLITQRSKVQILPPQPFIICRLQTQNPPFPKFANRLSKPKDSDRTFIGVLSAIQLIRKLAVRAHWGYANVVPSPRNEGADASIRFVKVPLGANRRVISGRTLHTERFC